MKTETVGRLIVSIVIIASQALAGHASYPKRTSELATEVSKAQDVQVADLALELLTGMPDNVLDPDVPLLLTINLYSPLALIIHEQNRDRKADKEPREMPEISGLIEGKPWWESLSLSIPGEEMDKDIPFQILGEPVQSEMDLGEGGVSSCRIAVDPGILPAQAVLFVSIDSEKLQIRSKNVDIRIEPGVLTPIQKLEAWIPYHLAFGEMDLGVAKGRDLVALAPEFSSSYSYLAEALEAAGELEEAVDHVLKAIDLFEKAGEGEDPPFLYLEQLQRLQLKIKTKKRV